MARQSAKIARPTATQDADEAEALAAAAATLQAFARVENAEAVASAVISKWILTRMLRAGAARLAENVVFDLGDAKLAGMVTAGLPKAAEALAAAGFDFAKSFNDLSKEEAVTLFVAGCVAYREVAVAAGEDSSFPFSDPIPFGGPIKDEECTH